MYIQRHVDPQSEGRGWRKDAPFEVDGSSITKRLRERKIEMLTQLELDVWAA